MNAKQHYGGLLLLLEIVPSDNGLNVRPLPCWSIFLKLMWSFLIFINGYEKYQDVIINDLKEFYQLLSI